MRRPKITHRRLEGVIHATSFVLAGESDNFTPEQWKEIEDADQWARQMREWLQSKPSEVTS